MKRSGLVVSLAASLAAAAAEPGGQVLTEAQLRQRAGKVLLFATPEYPRSALREQAEATVDVTGTLHPDGTFEARSVETASPRHEFRQAVGDVTRLWMLRPAYGADCMPQATPHTVRVWFEIKQGEGSISVSQPAEQPHAATLVLRRVAGSDPPYPYEARKLGLQADIEALLRVNPAGEVEAVSVVPGPMARFFRPEVARALAQWRFEPHGAPGPVCYRVESRFRQSP